MNSHFHAFDLPHGRADAAATPLPCPRRMHSQDITPWTMSRLAAALLRSVLPVSAAAPVSLNRRA